METLSDIEKTAAEYAVEMKRTFSYDPASQLLTITVPSTRFPYGVDLERVKTRDHLLSWVIHLSHKGWMNRDMLGEFVRRVMQIKNWERTCL